MVTVPKLSSSEVVPLTMRANWLRVIAAISWLPGAAPALLAGLVVVRVWVQPAVAVEPAITVFGRGGPQALSIRALAHTSAIVVRRRSAPSKFTPWWLKDPTPRFYGSTVAMRDPST